MSKSWDSKEVCITRNHNGSYTLSNVFRGQWYWKTYHGYVLQDAMRLFKAHCLLEDGKVFRCMPPGQSLNMVLDAEQERMESVGGMY
jgi:hypothetical protein